MNIALNPEATADKCRETCWPAPETPQNLNAHCCNLGLSDQQEDDIVAFLKTLTDGYVKGGPCSSAERRHSLASRQVCPCV